MNKFDTARIATNGLLLILSLIVIFHVLIILRVIPFEMVWGGRLENVSQMLTFETISIAINLSMLMVVGIHAGLLPFKINPVLLKAAFWIMFGLFLLNTLGNAFSKDETEKIIFTPLTLLLSLFSLRLALHKERITSY
ncbi:MAG: hypothetical protein JWQ14_438 [Adhaeribacter sp.]|nr:hypothetical protein [Adhaeribacter sp.]